MNRAGRRTSAVGIVLALLVVSAVVTWLLVRPQTYVAPAPRATASDIDAPGAAQALEQLQQAIEDDDASAAEALAPSGDQAAAALLGAVVDNAQQLRVADLSMRYVDESGGVDARSGWQAAVDLGWRFAGYDPSTAHEEVTVGFALAGDRVAITGIGGGGRRTPVWLSGPAQVRRSADALVLTTGSSSEADLLAQRADAAVPVVRDVLPQWRGKLVVEAPATEDGLDAALAADPGTYTAIAAVTAAVDGSVERDAQLHVFVNPAVYDDLDPVGGQVVLSHETTHVATKAPLTAGVPQWLLEGFADYVALHDVDLPKSTTAGQIIAQVRQGGVPDHLPDQTDFDPSATQLGASYESAWVANLVLADRGGRRALVRLYERVSATGSLTQPLRDIFGLTEDQLTADWQARLRQLAATDGA